MIQRNSTGGGGDGTPIINRNFVPIQMTRTSSPVPTSGSRTPVKTVTTVPVSADIPRTISIAPVVPSTNLDRQFFTGPAPQGPPIIQKVCPPGQVPTPDGGCYDPSEASPPSGGNPDGQMVSSSDGKIFGMSPVLLIALGVGGAVLITYMVTRKN